jgi:hypothetical protein
VQLQTAWISLIQRETKRLDVRQQQWGMSCKPLAPVKPEYSGKRRDDEIRSEDHTARALRRLA